MLWWTGMTVGVVGVLWLLGTPLVRRTGDAERVRRNIVASAILVAIGATLISAGAIATAPAWMKWVDVFALLLTSWIIARVGSLTDEDVLGVDELEGEPTPHRRRKEPRRMSLVEDARRREAARREA